MLWSQQAGWDPTGAWLRLCAASVNPASCPRLLPQVEASGSSSESWLAAAPRWGDPPARTGSQALQTQSAKGKVSLTVKVITNIHLGPLLCPLGGTENREDRTLRLRLPRDPQTSGEKEHPKNHSGEKEHPKNHVVPG